MKKQHGYAVEVEMREERVSNMAVRAVTEDGACSDFMRSKKETELNN